MNNYESVKKLAGSVAANWTARECEDAEDRLRQYVALALRVFERLERDPDAMARFEALTASRRELRMNSKGR